MIIFIVFTIIEVYIFAQLAKKKSNLLNETLVSYFGFCLSLLINFLCKLSVPDYIFILIMITIFGHTYIGNFLNFYNRSKHFDRYQHAFGSFSFALFVYSFIDKSINPVINSKLYSAIFVVALGISMGVVFEIIEFTHDSLLKTKKQKGLKDTDFDLISDVVGAMIAGVFAFYIFL